MFKICPSRTRSRTFPSEQFRRVARLGPSTNGCPALDRFWGCFFREQTVLEPSEGGILRLALKSGLMNIRQSFHRGFLGLSVLAICSCGSSTDFETPIPGTTSGASSLQVLNRFSLTGPGDQVSSQASVNPSGHVVYSVLSKDFEGETLDYEGVVILDRPGEGRRTLTVHSAGGATADQIIEFFDPHIDTSGNFASWRETVGGRTRIGYLAQGGGVNHWEPPVGTQFIKNLGVDSDQGHRLYALVDSQGDHFLVRYDTVTGEAAEYILPNIVSGSLDLVFDGTCRFATGLASDGQTTQLIYLVNNERPSVQVLTSEPVRTFTVNNIGDVGYTTESGDLTYLRPEEIRSQGVGSIGSVNTKVLGDAPALAMGNLYQTTSQALANAAHNATNSQQQSNITAQASTTMGVSTLYSIDTATTGVATSNFFLVTPQSTITNATSLIPPTFVLDALDIEGETATMVVSRDQGRDVQILRGQVPQ